MRHELKYVISPIQYQLLRDRLQSVLTRDKHAGEDGNYFIRSIYFDSYQYRAMSEKNMGIDNRQKYRIRFYNGNVEKCFLECKYKRGTRIEKESHAITEEERREIMTGEVTWQQFSTENVLERLKALVATERFHPTVVVDYLREAYVHPVSNLRITFDKEIAAGKVENAFDPKRCISSVLPSGFMVLEVKYDEYMPKHIAEMIASIRPTQVAASKYVMCMNKKMEGTIL